MKNDKQETPMEWFIEQLEEKGDLRETPSIRNIQLNIDTSDYMELKQQAKEMEKAQSEVTENTSDGYHTFKELYEFRKAYNVALFNEWGRKGLIPNPNGSYHPKYYVHKSWKHHDGELCFGGGWFIVVAVLPTGQISNHYKAEDWDLFKIRETEKALFEFDGHTSEDVINRLLKL